MRQWKREWPQRAPGTSPIWPTAEADRSPGRPRARFEIWSSDSMPLSQSCLGLLEVGVEPRQGAGDDVALVAR